MKETMMMQVSLKHEYEEDGESYVTHMITWVEADSKVKKGSLVTLEDDDKKNRWWTVEFVYQSTIPFRYINRTVGCNDTCLV